MIAVLAPGILSVSTSIAVPGALLMTGISPLRGGLDRS
jgi:hypothetical protein